jgi:hypothetical protein
MVAQQASVASFASNVQLALLRLWALATVDHAQRCSDAHASSILHLSARHASGSFFVSTWDVLFMESVEEW